MTADLDAIRAQADLASSDPFARVTISALCDEIAELRTEIAELRELLTWHATPTFEEDHRKWAHRDQCAYCNQPWPCPTERAFCLLHPEEAV